MKIQAITAATAIALVATQSALASTATAELSNLQIRLIDMDTGDGIAPAIVFANDEGGPFIAAESGTSWQHATDTHSGGVPFGNAISTVVRGLDEASARMSGDPFATGAEVSASAVSGEPGHYSASTVWLGDGGMYVTFALSPETRLVISGDADVSAMSTLDDPHVDTWASALFRLTDYTGLGDVSSDGVRVEQFGTGGAMAVPVTDQRHVEISFENDSTSSAGGIFFGSVDASASSLDPVPEPAGLALFGVGVLSLLAMRRRLSR
jgi:hypothetical protein